MRDAAVKSVMIDWYVTFATRSAPWSTGMRALRSAAERATASSGLVAPASGEWKRS
jgi:hypothetical protein